MVNKQKGSILIFTLWVLIILTILTIILSYRASSDVKLARRESYNIKTMYLARAGVMKMLAEIARDRNSYDSLNEDWRKDRDDPGILTIGDDEVFYGASDENSRLNLNSSTLKKEHLIRLGVDEHLAEQMLTYRIKKGAKGFEFMEELFLVDGMTRDDYSILEDSVTIYRGEDQKVNINTASASVIEAILGDSGLVQDVLEYRKGPDGEEGTDDDGIFRDSSDISSIKGLDPALFSVVSDVFRIWAQSFLSEDKKIFKEIEAVIDKSGKIYHWKEY